MDVKKVIEKVSSLAYIPAILIKSYTRWWEEGTLQFKKPKLHSP